MLDEIRDLFNQDVISHGKVKGLETSTLLNELGRGGEKNISDAINYYNEASMNGYIDATFNF